MTPEEYDAWYDRPQGRWIGEVEYRLIVQELAPNSEGLILDVGCGTGWFTRRFSHRPEYRVTGVDINADNLAFARRHDPHTQYVRANALALPFEDNSFDAAFSVAALCFVGDWQRAVQELVRVCRGSFAIGMLNRHSLLWMRKGRNGGRGAYRGAFWVDGASLIRSVEGLPVDVRSRSAVFLPSDSVTARAMEQLMPQKLLLGGMVFLIGQKS